jgi:hypothetical protein
MIEIERPCMVGGERYSSCGTYSRVESFLANHAQEWTRDVSSQLSWTRKVAYRCNVALQPSLCKKGIRDTKMLDTSLGKPISCHLNTRTMHQGFRKGAKKRDALALYNMRWTWYTAHPRNSKWSADRYCTLDLVPRSSILAIRFCLPVQKLLTSSPRPSPGEPSSSQPNAPWQTSPATP